VSLERARLEFPENQQAPIAAQLALRTTSGVAIAAEFDFRQKGEQSWDIELITTSGSLTLSRGGAGLTIDGKIVTLDEGLAGEYPRLYALCRALWQWTSGWTGGRSSWWPMPS
jgi:hypothetical protein